MSAPRVAVVGPGAVGGYYGGMLARAGAPVTMLGRPGEPGPHLRAMARDGLRLLTTTFDERIPVEVAGDAAALERANLVLFAVKSTDTEEAARRIRPHLAEGAIVLALQNGVDNPERMRATGLDPVAAVVYVAAAVEAPGEVVHRGRGDLVIGHSTRRADAERVAGWLEPAGIPCKVVDDIERELWVKLTLNAMANAISALADATYREINGFAPAWQLAEEVARETVAVAAALSHDLHLDAILERGRAVTTSVGDATSSTQQDMARGRPTEIDALNGYVAERGAAAGVPTPVNRTLWALVKLRERTARARGETHEADDR